MKQEMSQRQQRAATLINTVLAEGFQQGKILKENVNYNPVTITRVTITPDLRVAYCYFLPFNTKMTIKQIEDLLYEYRFAIRSFVTKNIKLKYSPEIKFYYDSGFENLNEVEAILDRLSKKNK